MQIPVQVDVKGRSIMGVFHIPHKFAKGTPVIVMCYGFNGNRVEQHRMSVYAAKRAAQQGVAFMRIDYRGLGNSEGEFWESSISSKVEDITKVIDFIQGCFQSKENSLFLLGFSDGIKIASEVLSLREHVCGIAMWSPIFFSNPVFFKSRTRPKLVREPGSKEMVCPFYGLWVGVDHLRELAQTKAFDNFCQFEGPKLCIYGENDFSVAQTRKAFEEARLLHDQDLKIVTIPGAKHLFGRTEWTREVIDVTINWVLNSRVLKNG